MKILKVKEMSCQHCVERITKVLEAANINFEVSLETKTVKIDGDEEIIRKAVEELDDIGFTAVEE